MRTFLESRGFACGEQAVVDDEAWDECRLRVSGGEQVVVLRGSSIVDITLLDVAALDDDGSLDEAAVVFLEEMAAVPCDGCDPDAARAWVRQNVGAGGEAVVGPLRLYLYGDRTTVLQVRAGTGAVGEPSDEPPEEPPDEPEEPNAAPIGEAVPSPSESPPAASPPASLPAASAPPPSAPPASGSPPPDEGARSDGPGASSGGSPG